MKGQKRFSSVGKLLSDPPATLVSRIMLGFVSLGARATRVPTPGVLAASIPSCEPGLLKWLVSRSAWTCTPNALTPLFLLAPMGRLGVDALLRRGRSEEPCQA